MTVSSHPLWTADQVAAALGVSSTGDWAAQGVSIDSRTLQPGDLFVAIKGDRFDGHAFVADALAKGAAAAIVSDPAATALDKARTILVDDTLDALVALARAARARTRAKVIAVTGSVGKTGTKDALACALGALGKTYATAGNLNNHIGLPLSLANLPQNCRFTVLELGMNHAGEIEALSHLAQPDVAVITTVEPVHLEFFECEEAIADAKAEIFAGMTAAGVAVLNRDNRHFARLKAAAERCGVTHVLAFGRTEDAVARVLARTLHPASSTVKANICGTRIDYTLPVPGAHVVQNSLAVLGAVHAVGGDIAKAAARLSRIEPPRGRGNRLSVALPYRGEIEVIDESYNASPASMRAAFEVLGRSETRASGRRIAVLGDMLELGPDATKEHADLAFGLQRAEVDLVFTCGPNMSLLAAALPAPMVGGHAPDSAALASRLCAALRGGDVVMVKGSLGSRMAVVIEALTALGASAPLALAANGS